MTTTNDRDLARAAIREAATQAWGEPDHGGQKILDHYADAIVDALNAAGRLVPANATVVREYEVKLTYGDGTTRNVWCAESLDRARSLAASPANWETPGEPGQIIYADVTTFESGWKPLTDEPTATASPAAA